MRVITKTICIELTIEVDDKIMLIRQRTAGIKNKITRYESFINGKWVHDHKVIPFYQEAINKIVLSL